MVDIIGVYNQITGAVPQWLAFFLNLFLLTILIVLISLFIWKFYKTISQKSFVSLNLARYNTSEHPVAKKIVATFIYFIENMLITPFFILLWFTALTLVIILMAPEKSVDFIIIISASLIVAIRILAYIHQEIAKDLAKLFPLITLSIFLLNPENLNLSSFINNFQESFILIYSLGYYILFIFVFEVILRLFYSLGLLLKSEEES